MNAKREKRTHAQPRLLLDDKATKTRAKPDFTLGKKKYTAELIPPALVIARYYAQEQAAIDTLEAQLAAYAQQMGEMAEEHGGEGGLLEDAKNDKDKLTTICCELTHTGRGKLESVRWPSVGWSSRISTPYPDGLAVSIITYGEIYDGIYHGPNQARHERGFRQFLRVARVLPLTRRIMQRFAHLRGDLRQEGRGLADPDLLIAATALHHDLTVVTRNRRHFERIPGLLLCQEG